MKMKDKADYDPRAGTAKPGMVIMIGVIDSAMAQDIRKSVVVIM